MKKSLAILTAFSAGLALAQRLARRQRKLSQAGQAWRDSAASRAILSPSSSRKRSMFTCADCCSRFAFIGMLLHRAKRHRCPQIPLREWEFQGTSPSKEEGEAERRKARLGSKNAPFGRSAAASCKPGPFFRGLGSWRFRAARLSPSSQLKWQAPF